MAATEKTVNFLHDFYALVDAGETDEYMKFFAEDARVIFANNPPLDGHQAIRDGLSQMLSGIASMKHEFRGIWDLEDDVIYVEVDVTFSRQDGQVVQVPGAVVCELRDGFITEERAYVDMTPVFA